MEKDEKEYTGDYCKFLESEIVQGIYHGFCLNQRMHEINKVKNNKKLPCIGDRCGLAVLDKENNQGKADFVHARADWEQAVKLNPNDEQSRANLEWLRGMGY